MRVLLVDPETSLPPSMQELLAHRGHCVETATDLTSAAQRATDGGIDVIVTAAAGTGGSGFSELMRIVSVQGMPAVVLGSLPGEAGAYVHRAPATATGDEILGRLSAIEHYHHLVQALERDLQNMQRLFRQLNTQFTEVDQETRLAGRLQAEFLPKDLTLGPARFATLFRPATFVSGDMYDISRVDEDQIAFYIADAVGHGMAASLLTMFIRNAVVSKRIEHDVHRVLDPNETLSMLNRKLCDQHLPNSQFVTACYALLNTRTLELRYARAGHPYPLVCSRDGRMRELKSTGGLLGLFADESYPAQSMTLKPGDKVIMYSDGLEVAFAPQEGRQNAMQYYREALASVVHLPARQMTDAFGRLMDNEAGSLNPRDDISMIVLEIDPPKE